MTKRIAFNTLGCKLNQYETDSLASQFFRAGYEVVPYEAEADAYVINTCTVTNKSDRKSRNMVNRATGRAVGTAGAPGAAVDAATRATGAAPATEAAFGRFEQPAENASSATASEAIPPVPASETRPVVVVTGCFVDSNRDYLAGRSDITYVVDNARKNNIFHIVDAHFRGEILDPARLDSDPFGYALAEKGFHTRSMVKIQDGCDNFCTFCIIPYVRGRATSRPLPAVLDNVRRLVDAGTREVVLTGVNMGRYRDGESDFADVVEAVLDLPGDFRVRISSLEPEPSDERFIDLLGHPKMCPHLHLCLQSGSERILLAMRRMYTLAGYLEFVERLRSRYPGFNLTTDVIVGFPGESDADFEETARVCREVAFSHIHTFKYSRREGTRADRMPNQVSEVVKSARSERIREIGSDNKRRYRSTLLGSVQTVLVESVDAEGCGQGYGEHYVPVTVCAAEWQAQSSPRIAENRFCPVRLTALEEGEEPVFRGEPLRFPLAAIPQLAAPAR